jgi:hypothetical protein
LREDADILPGQKRRQDTLGRDQPERSDGGRLINQLRHPQVQLIRMEAAGNLGVSIGIGPVVDSILAADLSFVSYRFITFNF